MHQDYETGNHAMFSPFNYAINSNFCEKFQKPAGRLALQDKILFIPYEALSHNKYCHRFYTLVEILKYPIV